MGNQTNARLNRLGISMPYDAVWYSDKEDFSKKLLQDFKIRQFLENKLKSAGVVRTVIRRSVGIEVELHSTKPGMVVGRKGSDIESLAAELTSFIKEDVSIKVVEVKRPALFALTAANELSVELKKRKSSCRRLMKKIAQTVLRAGANGIRMECCGRLSGAEIARRDWYQEGSVPRQKFRSFVDYAQVHVKTGWGVCGVKVWVNRYDIIGKDAILESLEITQGPSRMMNFSKDGADAKDFERRKRRVEESTQVPAHAMNFSKDAKDNPKEREE